MDTWDEQGLETPLYVWAKLEWRVRLLSRQVEGIDDDISEERAFNNSFT